MTGAPPLITAIARPWWDALARNAIEMQRCDTCTAWVFYPRPFCPSCGSRLLTWQAVSHRATLYTWSIAHVAVAPQFAHLERPVLAVAELENGVRVPTSLILSEGGLPRIGMALEAVFDHATYREATLLRFRDAD